MAVRRALAGSWSLYIEQFETPPVGNPEAFLGILSESVAHHSQMVRADRVAGIKHVELAAIQAFEAWMKGVARAKKLEVEFLLRLACTDQISEAIRRVGLSRGTRTVLLVVFVRGPLKLAQLRANMLLRPRKKPLPFSLRGLASIYRVHKRHLQVVKSLFGTSRDEEALPYCLTEMSSLIHP